MLERITDDAMKKSGVEAAVKERMAYIAEQFRKKKAAENTAEDPQPKRSSDRHGTTARPPRLAAMVAGASAKAKQGLQQQGAISATEHVDTPEEAEQRWGQDNRHEVYGSLRTAVGDAIERNVMGISPELRERLKADLLDNATYDYSRINLTEVFIGFNFDADQTVAHWRLAKIMDGITMCATEFGILEDTLHPTAVPLKIYDVIRAGKVNDKSDKTWKINVQNPDAQPGDKEDEPQYASLADFAYLVDVLKANRELGLYRLPLPRLLYNFFHNKDLTTEPVEHTDAEGKKSKKSIDLRDQTINPRDTYSGQDAINIDSYIAYVKKSQTGMQQLGDWRYDSDKHRELAGQVYLAKIGPDLFWIPISGRMASEVSKEDLQKSGAEGGKAGVVGQPQEVGEMEESHYGNVVRFRMRDLVQRNIGGTVQSLSGTTRRMHKAMMGLNLKEEAAKVSTEEMEFEKDNGSKEKKTTKVVYLGGDDQKGRSGDIIRAMHIHYDKAYTRMRGAPLTDNEAYDLTLVDVFAPCMLNNSSDWLIALAKVYPDIGGSQKERGIVNNPDKFQDFVLKIKCLNLETHKIEWQPFYGFNELLKYVHKRVKLGHIDQPIEEGMGAVQKIKESSYPIKEKFENADEAKNYGELATLALGAEYGPDYLDRWSQDRNNLFPSIRTHTGEFIPYVPKQKNRVEGRTMLTFDQIVNTEINNLRSSGNIADLYRLLGKIYGADFSDESDEEESQLEEAIRAFISTLSSLPPVERQKMK